MTSSRSSRVQYHCSFCGKNQDQVKRLIAGPGAVYICDECVELCREIIDEESAGPAKAKVGPNRIPPPKAVYNHYKRIGAGAQSSDVELEKTNILLVGPTGVGKTHLARTLARILDVPFTIADATALTEAGYVGEDVENILLHLIQAADFDIQKAERGIIYINTTSILFICGGAFEGLDKIIERRLAHNRRSIGFKADYTYKKGQDRIDELLKHVTHDDLLQYGLIPEFVGRLPVTVSLEALGKDELRRILTEPRNALVKQFQRFFAMDGVELAFTDDALEACAEDAITHKTGARGLRTVLEDTLLDVMYEIPSRGDVKKCVVTGDVTRSRQHPLLLSRSGQAVPDEVSLPEPEEEASA